ncbi:DUF2894 domain-containing protein [Variovorax robiniae]|uniref:DUF2894 domain-containing protein n=1 Tax=Variovorax robiniae TaxID=1836199 RepID=A0ABU8X3Y8_9BURK
MGSEVSAAGVAVAADLDAGATLDVWRKQGAHRLDPVRFRFIEAMAKRTAAHSGEVRRLLDDKLAALLRAYGEDLAKAGPPTPRPKSSNSSQSNEPPRGPLAELVEQLGRLAPSPARGPAAVTGVAPMPTGTDELKSLSYFRSTWSKLSADRRLTQSLAKVPGNAGPLNSQHLVHQALTLMRDLSPEYLNRFMAYVDTLLWLEQADAGSASAAAAESPRGEGPRKAGRSKSK